MSVQRPRLLFVDNLRWSMIVLVLSMHACDTYSPFGNWYFTDRRPESFAVTAGFGLYQTLLQAFFMALLFFLSGYFAAGALERRGGAPFALERFVRLGLPTLLYMLAIGPLTQYYLSHTWGSGGFPHQWIVHLMDGEWLSNSGPMWFCAVLLLFSWVYAVLPAIRARRPAPRATPSLAAIALFIVAMSTATFAVRAYAPESTAVLNVHPGDLASYVLMFAAGIAAAHKGWLDSTSGRRSALVSALCLLTAVFLLIVIVQQALHTPGGTDRLSGGLNGLSLLKSFWEGLVCIGMTYGFLALYRAAFNWQNVFTRFMSDNAFAVYLFHPPVIIAAAILISPLRLWPPFMVVLLTAIALAATYLLSALVFRRLPVLRRIL